MYLQSPNLSQISLKNSLGKVVFQILAEIEMSHNEIGYLTAILKRFIYLFFLKYSCDKFIYMA